MEKNVKFSVSSSYFIFLWFIYSRLDGVSQALVWCVCVCVAKRKTRQKLHNFGDSFLFFFWVQLSLFIRVGFKFWAAGDAKLSRVDHRIYGFRMDARWSWPHLLLTINRVAIKQMRVNWRSNRILIYIEFEWYLDAIKWMETKNVWYSFRCFEWPMIAFAIELKRVFRQWPIRNRLSNLFWLFWKYLCESGWWIKDAYKITFELLMGICVRRECMFAFYDAHWFIVRGHRSQIA